MKSVLFAVFAIFTLVTSASAKDIFYECDIPQRASGGGYISPKMAILVRSNGAVQVIDALLIRQEESPKTVQVMRNDNSVLSARWSLRFTNSSKQQAKLDYSVRLNKANMSVRVFMRPNDYNGQFSSPGKCKLRKQ